MKQLTTLLLTTLLLFLIHTVGYSNKSWPDCAKPQSLRVIGENENQIMISWEGEIPAYEKIRYELEVQFDNGKFYKDIIYDGLTFVINKQSHENASIRLKTLCDGQGDQYDLFSKWSSIQYEFQFHKQLADSYELNLPKCESGYCEEVSVIKRMSFDEENNKLILKLFDVTQNPPKQYIVRYRFTSGADYLYFILDEDENTYELPVSSYQNLTYFEAQFGFVRNEECYCGWGNFLFEEEEDSFECGNHPPTPDLSNTTAVNLSEGNIVFINNFPLIISQLNSKYSGQGYLTIPFRETKLFVNFSGLQVNSEGIAFNGQVTGMYGSPGITEILNDTLAFGQEICIPPTETSGWDENGLFQPGNRPFDSNGFGINGKYNKPPFNDSSIYDTEYDPNGFDKDGNHVITKGAFNENGCNQQGFDKDGNPCDPAGEEPYYWMTSKDIIYATEYWDSLSQVIQPLIDTYIDSLSNVYTDTLSHYSSAFNAKQSEVYNNLSLSGITPVFVVGPDSIFAEQGMSKNMIERPREFTSDVSSVYKNLNSSHQQLYDIDKKLIEAKGIKTGVDSIQSSENNTFMLEQLEFKIKQMSKDEIDKLKDENVLKQWLNSFLISRCIQYISSKHHSTNTKPQLNGKIRNYFDHNSDSSLDPYYGYSSTNFLKYPSKGNKLDADYINYAINNGLKTINGTSTAFYLEKMTGQMETTGGYSGDRLPISIAKTAYGVTYNILISKIIILPTTAHLDAYLIIDEPNSGKRIVFEGENIPFSPGGLLDDDLSKLKLKSTIGFRLTNAMKAYVNGDNNMTYVSWDCNGVQEVSADISVEVCRNYLIPIDMTTNKPLPEPENVEFNFLMSGQGWGDFYGEIDIDPFVVNGYEDITWNVENVKFDYSSVKSPTSFSDTDYNTALVQNGIPSPLWKGVSLEQLSSTLPRSFQKDSGPITVGLEKAIFDGNGFSGNVFVEDDILSLDEGDLDGWAFSIDKFFLKFRFNNLLGGGLKGLIHIPLVKNDKTTDQIKELDCFEYEGSYTKDGGFNFGVSIKEEVNVPMWIATLNLHQNSAITVKKFKEKFRVYSNLHGDIDISGDLAERLNVKIEGLSFQNLQLSNIAPHFKPGVWSVPDKLGANFGSFGINVKIPTPIEKKDGKIGLDFGLYLNLSKALGISAGGGFEIIGKLEKNSKGRQIWKYDDFYVSEILLEANIKKVVELYGRINFFKDDPVYGKGFQGVIKMKVAPLDNISIAAMGLFGTTEYNHSDSYKYFLADAMVNLGSGVNIYAGLKLMGFGGGMYYHMSRLGDASLPLNTTDQTSVQLPQGIGNSLSGVKYLPNYEKYLGLKSTIGLAYANPKALNANLSFEVLFYKNNEGKLGGVDKIYLDGCAKLMADFDVGQLPIKGLKGVVPNLNIDVGVKANMHLEMNFMEKSLDGNLEVFFNSPFLKGGYDNNGSMGIAEFRAAPGEYYLNVGRPDKRCEIKATLPLVGDLLKFQGYLDIGNNVPPLASLPASLSKYNDQFRIDESLRNSGTGFAFGMSTSIPEKRYDIECSWLPDWLLDNASLYLEADLGMDMMIQNYSDLSCGQYNPIGINGWYGMGNLYGYMGGHVKYNDKTYVSLSTSSIIQAKLPNPNMLKGALEFKFEILGFNADWSANFSNGDECSFQGSTGPLAGKKFISGSTPYENEENVPVITNPMITFNYPIDKEFSAKDVNGFEAKYKLEIADFSLTYHSGSAEHELVMSENHQAAHIQLKSMLKPNTEYTLFCEVRLYKGSELEETELYEIEFTTGEAPKDIPVENVTFSYPYQGMTNFYLHELGTEKGFLVFDVYQYNVFDFGDNDLSQNTAPVSMMGGTDALPAEATVDYTKNALYAKFTKQSGEVFITHCSLDKQKQKMQWDMPKDKFVKGSIYKLEIMANNTIAEQYPIHTIYFRVSRYDSFTEKLNDYYQNHTIHATNAKEDGVTIELNAQNAREFFSKDELKHTMVVQSVLPLQWYSKNMKSQHKFALDNYIPTMNERLENLKLTDFDQVFLSREKFKDSSSGGSIDITSIGQNNYIQEYEAPKTSSYKGEINEDVFKSEINEQYKTNLIIKDKSIQVYWDDFSKIKEYAQYTQTDIKKKYGDNTSQYGSLYYSLQNVMNKSFKAPTYQYIIIGYKIPGNANAKHSRTFNIEF